MAQIWKIKGSFLDAIIKRIDESYDKNAVNDEKAQKLDELKQRLELANKSKIEPQNLKMKFNPKLKRCRVPLRKN